MGWVRFEDTFLDHPKVTHVGRDARDFWIAAMCWSSEKQMDGFVPTGALSAIAGQAGVHGRPSTLVAKLLTYPPGFRVGLFEAVDGGYIVHDYLDYNPTAAELEALHQARAAAGKAGGKQSASKRRSKREANASPNPDAVAKQDPKQNPTPVPRPHVPSPDGAPTTSEPRSPERNTEEVVAFAAEAPAARQIVRAVPKESQGVPKPHQAMIAALGEALGDPKTKGDWGKYATAAADLCRAGAEPERIGWLVSRWDELFPGATCTPTALSNNYATLTSDRKAPAKGHAERGGSAFERNLAKLGLPSARAS